MEDNRKSLQLLLFFEAGRRAELPILIAGMAIIRIGIVGSVSEWNNLSVT